MIRRAATCALPLLLAAAAAALSAEPWFKRNGSETPGEVASAFPESATWLRRHIGTLVNEGKDAEARQSLERLAAMGFGLSPAGQQQTARLLDQDLRYRFEANARPVGEPRDEAAIPASFGLIEGAVAVSGSWVASSITGQDQLVSRNGRNWRAMGLRGLASLSGLAVDRRRGLVWVSSGLFEQTPRPDGAFSGLLFVDPRRGRIARRVAAPDGVVTGDIALAADGSVLASDPISGGLWKLAPGAGGYSPIVAPGTLRSPQGIAESADGRRLYVSDYGTGIAIVNVASGTVERLAAKSPMMLDGIDGLVRHGNELFGFQNGTRPMRIVAIRLSPDGTKAAGLRILLSRLPGDGEHTTGEIRRDRLHYVANARWDAYGKGGALKAGTNPGETRLQSLPLSP